MAAARLIFALGGRKLDSVSCPWAVGRVGGWRSERGLAEAVVFLGGWLELQPSGAANLPQPPSFLPPFVRRRLSGLVREL